MISLFHNVNLFFNKKLKILWKKKKYRWRIMNPLSIAQLQRSNNLQSQQTHPHGPYKLEVILKEWRQAKLHWETKNMKSKMKTKRKLCHIKPALSSPQRPFHSNHATKSIKYQYRLRVKAPSPSWRFPTNHK